LQCCNYKYIYQCGWSMEVKCRLFPHYFVNNPKQKIPLWTNTLYHCNLQQASANIEFLCQYLEVSHLSYSATKLTLEVGPIPLAAYCTKFQFLLGWTPKVPKVFFSQKPIKIATFAMFIQVKKKMLFLEYNCRI